MSQKANYFKLGLFVIISFGLLAAFLIALGAGKFFKNEFLAETYFNESVQGLDIGSEVKYKGVKIGTVKTITTPTKIYNVPSSYVMVTFALTEDCYMGQTGETAGDRLKKAIDDGLTISLSFKGLTGAAYLETDYLSKRRTPLDIAWYPSTLYLPSRKSSIKRIEDAVNQILDNLSDLNMTGIGGNLGNLVKTLDEKANALNMAALSDQAETLLRELRATNSQLSAALDSGRLTRLISDATDSFAALKTIAENAKEPVDNSLKNIELASNSARKVAATLETGFAPKIDSLTKSLDNTLESLNRTSKMLENMVWINSDTVGKAIENFEDTSENLKQLSLELRQYPGRLLFEDPPQDNSPERIKEILNHEKN